MNRKTFFESISAADMERLHSQMISWIFSADCQVLSPEGKAEALRKLFGLPPDATDLIRFSATEIGGTDILIGTQRKLFVIENKLKSSVHSNQLVRYEAYVESDKFLSGGRERHYLLLSLVGEKPAAGYAGSRWQSASFDDLLAALCSAETANTSDDQVIFRQYIATLKRLVGIKNEFFSNLQGYSNVFTEGSKRKIDKLKERAAVGTDQLSANRQFISDNQLETILQKAYFTKVLAEISPIADSAIVGESRGNALIDIKRPFECPDLHLEDEEFRFGIQFQSGSVRVQIEADFDAIPKPTAKQLADKGKVLRDAIVKRRGELGLESSVWRFNPPKRRGQPYCSFSCRVTDAAPIWQVQFWSVVEQYKRAYSKALGAAQVLRGSLAVLEIGADDRPQSETST